MVLTAARLLAVVSTLAILHWLTASAWAGGSVETRGAVASTLLGRDIRFAAYQPAAGTTRRARLPLLLLLHGHGDDERAWLEKGDLAVTLDRLVASGAIDPMLVVMPAAGNSWYVDDAEPQRYGPLGTAFTTDLLAGLEAQLPAGGCREARAIGGLSMGGYGAVLLALDRSDLFGSSFSLSGSLFSDVAADIERRRATYERLYNGVFGRPFDTGRFLSDNVFVRLGRLRADRPRPAFWLAAGTRDFPSILEGTQRFHRELERSGFDSELRILDGEHTWGLWKSGIEPALIWLSRRFKTDCRSLGAMSR